jgi:hypothetical protein
LCLPDTTTSPLLRRRGGVAGAMLVVSRRWVDAEE